MDHQEGRAVGLEWAEQGEWTLWLEWPLGGCEQGVTWSFCF